MLTTPKNREVPIHFRATPDEKQAIAQAASICRQSVSEFVRQRAVNEAEQIIADQSHVLLPKAPWQAFCRALDEPAREIPAVVALMREPGRFGKA